jgi:hypothetical protein
MSSSQLAKGLTLEIPFAPSLPAKFLNAYAVLNPSWLSWPVKIYNVKLLGPEAKDQEVRRKIKDVIWDLRREHEKQCRGFGFVVGIDANQVATSANWNLPVPITTDEYSVRLVRALTATATDKECRPIVEGILLEAIKMHFKEKTSPELGSLWQDYNSFCQYPVPSGDEEHIMCRRFGFGAKLLSGGTWVIRLTISTTALDSRTFADYYARGEVLLLADRLEAKRRNRVTRENQPSAIRVVQQYRTASAQVRALEFEDYDLVMDHANLSAERQVALTAQCLHCSEFKKGVITVPAGELRLILDTQITGEDHSQTIIEPAEREELTRQLRSFVDGAWAYGQTIRLSEEPVDAESLGTALIAPPDVRVRGPEGEEVVIETPEIASEASLKARARERGEHIRKYGFLVRRAIDPLLAWPSRLGQRGGVRLKEDLESIWESQGIQERFRLIEKDDVEEIRQAAEQGGHDALLAVLPERSDWPARKDDTHERIKQRIEIPSQCIHWDNTLPRQWVDRPQGELEEANPKLARRILQKYQLSLGNLLVKSHWFPFAPATPFNYNVQVGLDVGGIHDTDAMACLGYGFARPLDFLVFRLEQIPIEVQKPEPIPPDALYRGLFSLFHFVRSELLSIGIQSDFGTCVFYRDGRLLGEGDKWNETDALKRLHAEFLDRGWITESSTWTAVEVMKDAEGWRLFRGAGGVANPVAGTCVFPYEDEKTALVCTTGAPYLTQGTAHPLMIHIIDIHGTSVRERVIRDLVWQADMCFTKPDTGMRLPWVLHVADVGALQLSRSYRIAGITV